MPLFKDEFEVPDEALDDLRSKFLEAYNSGPEEAAKYHADDIKQVKENDWFIARYLLHQQLNVDNALEMLKKSLHFRKEMEINTLQKEDIPMKYFDNRSLQIYNCDKEGRPFMIIRVKAHKKISAEIRLQQQYWLYWVEKAVQDCDLGKLVFFFDCTDAGYKNVDMDLVKFFMNLLQLYYPWSTRVILVHNLPWFLNAIWKIIKAWIPEKHQNIIVFPEKDQIFEYIEKEQFPVCLGGTCTDQYGSKDV